MLLQRKYFLLILALSGNVATAQVSIGSVEDAWKYADAHNVSIRNAKYESDKSRAAIKQSYMAFLPTASVQGTFTENTSLQTTLIPAVIFGGPDGTYRAVQFGQKYIYSGAISVQLDLVNLQTWYNTSIAKTTQWVNEASLANAKKATYQQIAAQYYNFILMDEAATLATRSRAIADTVYQSVKHKFDEGTVNKGSLDQAELNRDRAEKDLLSAQYQKEIAKNNLKGLLNMAANDELTIYGVFDYNAISRASEVAFAADPAAVVAIRQVTLSNVGLRVARAGYLPTLSLQYNTSKQQNDNEFRPLQGGVPWYNANYWTLKATWTILNGGARWLQIQKSRIAADQANLQYDNAIKQSAINDENLRLNAKRAAAVLEKAKHIMELALDNYQHVSNKYEEGLVPLDDRLNAMSDYINYQNQYLNSLSDYLIQQYSTKIRQQNY